MEQFKHYLNKLSHIMELFVALIVLCAIIVSIFHLYQPFIEYVFHAENSEYFIEFLTRIFKNALYNGCKYCIRSNHLCTGKTSDRI